MWGLWQPLQGWGLVPGSRGIKGVGIADGEFTWAEGRVWEAGCLQRTGCGEEESELYMAWAWPSGGRDRGLWAEMEVEASIIGAHGPQHSPRQVDEGHAGRLDPESGAAIPKGSQ